MEEEEAGVDGWLRREDEAALVRNEDRIDSVLSKR
jgi:hypothetical protein